jgi:hypothetical protein
MAKIKKTVSTLTQNKAGGSAYKLPSKEKFVTNLLTNLYQEDKYYGDNTPELISLTESLVKSDPEFVARATIYAREVMNLRTAPVAVLAHLFLSGNGKLGRKVLPKVATRPDQLTELVAYLNQFDKHLPKKLHQLRKGISDSLNNYDGYQLAKYKGGNSPTLKDLVRISHPKPKDEAQAKLFKQLLDDNLATAKTWESETSAKGNTKEVWQDLLNQNKLPYMAMLRNLRNIVETGVSLEHRRLVCETLANVSQVRKSKQFPFRFYSAYNVLRELNHEDVSDFLKAVASAIGHSVENIEDLPGVTFTTADNSGSMSSLLSSKSTVMMRDIANVLQAILAKGCKQHIGSVFGDRFKVVNVNPDNDILNNADIYKNTNVGHSTNAYLAIQHLLDNKVKVDRIIILSDMQVYGLSSWTIKSDLAPLFSKYRKEINPKCWLHSIDLAGYGTTPVVGENVNLIAGWSDKVLNYISAVERGQDSMIKDINKVAL